MIVWRGAPALNLNDLPAPTIIGAIFGVIGVTVLVTLLFVYPFFYRLLVMEDWTLRWYHVGLGPFLWKRGPVPWCPEEQRIVVQNYYRGHLTKEELAARDASVALYREATELGERMNGASTKQPIIVPVEIRGSTSTSVSPVSPNGTSGQMSPNEIIPNVTTSPTATTTKPEEPRDQNFKNYVVYTVWPFIKSVLLHGVNQDIVHLQQRDTRTSRTRRLEKMHSRAAHYDNQTEHLFSFLQILSASVLSVAHGYPSLPSPRLSVCGVY